MAEDLDLKTVVKHLANGTLGDQLCLVCLLPLTEDNYENIFTFICKIDEEYCVADVLREVCQLKIPDTEHYNICCNCFQSASTAYQFYLKAKQSFEILKFYTDQFFNNMENLEITEDVDKPLVCIRLPVFNTEISFDYGFEGIGTRNIGDDETNDVEDIEDDDDEVILVVEDKKTVLYRLQNDGLVEIENEEAEDENMLMIVNERTRKKRDPMMYIPCLYCPVKYRFVSKLKEHMKKMHNAEIYYCQICKLITDKKDDYEEHLSTHIGKFQCTKCNSVYSKEFSLIEHMKCHERNTCEVQIMTDNGNICEICGVILENEKALEVHRSERHVKRYTCYYCGKMYKGRVSFESHIAKHEKHLKERKELNTHPNIKQETKLKESREKEKKDSSNKPVCGVCGKSFVDERALLWHQRLHNNERPYICNICSRGFVSAHRRNQHAVCAHTRPARRCPLCPALFHLRSMVNTHVKKVHLNRQNKRRNRVAKHTNVFWRTETVPIQELSVSIQNEVMEMQSTQEQEKDSITKTHGNTITILHHPHNPSSSAPEAKHHRIDMDTQLSTHTTVNKTGGASIVWMGHNDVLMQESDYEYRSNDYILSTVGPYS